MSNFFNPSITNREEEKKRAVASKKEEEQIARDKKKVKKKQETMSYKESFNAIWSSIVIMAVGFWTGLTFAWSSAMEFINFSGKLSAILVNHFGDGSSVIMEHNTRVTESALIYILMFPFYILTGISGLFIYNSKYSEGEMAGKRIFSEDTSFMRKIWYPKKNGSFLHKLTNIPPFLYIFGNTRHTDSSTFTPSLFSMAGLLEKFPYIASFFLPILFTIIISPTIRPSLISMVITTAVIIYFVVDAIYQIWKGQSIQDMVDGAIPAEEPKGMSGGFGDAKTMDRVEAMAGNGSILLIISRLLYSFFHIIMGVLSIIPAAYGSSFYVWFVSVFAWMFHKVSLKQLLKELNRNSSTYKRGGENNRESGLIDVLIPFMTDRKGIIASIICILISMSVLIQILDDSPLFVILSAIVVLSGLTMGALADIGMNGMIREEK